MNKQLIRELVQGSYAATITFPDIVGKLIKEGVESYHVDLVRGENRYYWPNGESHVEALGHAHEQAAVNFSAKDVESAVRASQAGQIKYPEFLRRILNAGCVYYVTYLSGKKVAYFGRDGGEHTELFPQRA